MVRPEITGCKIGQPLVASTTQAMIALGIARAKLYEKLNTGELESYMDGGSRKILWDSIRAYIQRRLDAEASPDVKRSERARALVARRGKAA